ncbi:hypothetical protein SDC9_174063 [bioreactor metagenome]|uniref:IPTL-CTERM protein sorting domain-containing protein n=1 Tax=bioreactor metagenome TaxID=1076179 RepID=A0A645GI85_9ZZZZ
MTTDGSGTLTSVFTKLAQNTTSLNPGDYTFVSPSIPGGPPDITPNHPYWFIPNSPGAGGLATYSGVFYIGSAGIDDVNGGVSTGTNTTGWAAPVEFTGTACAGQPLNAITAPSTGTAAPVPALGTPALVLLALAASGLGTRRLRQRKASA